MQIFQRNILRKYIESLNPDQVEKLYRRFAEYFLNPERQENIQNSKEEQFQEGFLRELFVQILGYILNPDPDFNLTTEKKNETNSKKADGAILVDGKVVGVVELKDHKTTDLSKVEAQAFNYKSQHKEAEYVVISNFEKLRFYIDNAVDYEEFDLFHLTKEDLARLWICLAYESIAKNLPKQIKEASVNNENRITNALYKDYSNFKRDLFEDILKNNPTDDNEFKIVLFKKTQKLLDRVLFILFAEDRGLLPPNSLMMVINQWEKLKDFDAYQPFYERLKKYFGYMNTGFQGKNYEVFAYNGGLFKPDEVLDGLKISDELLRDYCKKLSDYDFASDVDVNILGHIFENSLTEIEEITTKLQQGDAPTISKRKKDGVFYTPQYITKYIVENTVGKLCEEKKAELGIDESEYFADKKRQVVTKKALVEKLDDYRDWLLQITICDPACGSGAFLNAALNFLIEEHKLIDEMTAKVTGATIVFPNVENSILENNLYGVDINEESVEIAKLSLWLRTAKPHRKLSSLNDNIKCGNSLIDDPAIAGDKAFCWEKEFPKIFREKQKRAWHITTAVHDSRTSERMIEYDVRRLRDNGTRPYPEPMLLSTEEEIIITETVAKIVEEDKLNVLAYNICFDHMHLLLVCEEEEVPKIVGKIKSMTARAVNIAMGRTIPTKENPKGQTAVATESPVGTTAVATAGHDPLTLPDATLLDDELPKKGITQCSLWARKFGNTYINSDEHLYNAIEYIQTNREHHGLDPLPVEYPHCVSIEEAFRPEYTGGFDVVIGNPPYVRLQTMGKMSDAYEKCGYEVYNKTADLYCLFYERGCQLLNKKGLLGFIASNKWLKVNYGIQLRKYLTTKANPYILIDFPGVPVFEDATVDPQILLLSKEPYSGKTFACACKQTSDIALFIKENKKETTFGEDAWIIPDETSAIFEKMNVGIPLKYLPITINYGIKTGFNDAFFIDGTTRNYLIAEDPKSAELIKPLLRGRDLQAWVPDLVDQYLIFVPWHFPNHLDSSIQGVSEQSESDFANNYPAIYHHLLTYKEKLSARNKAETGIRYEWYALQRWAADYYKEFSKPKIMYPNMTKYLPFIYDETGYFGNDKTFIITSQDDGFSLKSLVAILNSKLAKLWIRHNCPELGDDRREIRKVYFVNFPIPAGITKTTAVGAGTGTDNGACPVDPTGPYPTGLSQFADQMLSLHSQLRQKRLRFLHRLEESLGVKKITAALERFDELDFKGFVAELKKQKIGLTLTQKDEWEDYFNQYKDDCNSLSAQIETTDKEIDHLVYELYGLTEDEIKVVEGEHKKDNNI
jgi:type I restriction-modification system DNA methylase subunit/REP element-mobilizing transposase RayT